MIPVIVAGLLLLVTRVFRDDDAPPTPKRATPKPPPYSPPPAAPKPQASKKPPQTGPRFRTRKPQPTPVDAYQELASQSAYSMFSMRDFQY